MKLVMTLLARDEADIVDTQIAFHLESGVDFVIATDNGSHDGTREIFESYAREGYLHLIDENGQDMQQAAWVTRMARLAATDFRADWVINSDADEFWCTHGAPLKAVLAEVPRRFSTVRALMRNFVPRTGDATFFADRMNVRLVPGEVIAERYRVHPFHAQDKVVHRAHPLVSVSAGNHDASWPSSVDLRGSWLVEILHFPMRSADQCLGKWRNYKRHGYSGYDVLTNHGALEYYESLVVDDAALDHGLHAGALVVDNRLRDTLRAIRHGDAARRDSVHLPPLSAIEAAALAADAAAGSERDALVKLEEQARALDARLASVERSPAQRLRAGHLLRRFRN